MFIIHRYFLDVTTCACTWYGIIVQLNTITQRFRKKFVLHWVAPWWLAALAKHLKPVQGHLKNIANCGVSHNHVQRKLRIFRQAKSNMGKIKFYRKLCDVFFYCETKNKRLCFSTAAHFLLRKFKYPNAFNANVPFRQNCASVIFRLLIFTRK